MKNTFLLLTLLAFSCTLTPEENIVEDILSPAKTNSSEPSFFKISDSQVGISWVESIDDTAILKYAIYEDRNWSDPKIVTQGDDWFVNWADFPGIVVSSRSNWLAWFLQQSDTATYAYDVMITQSIDKGNSWSTPKKLHNDSTLTEHGFVSVVPADDGFRMIWLDGRNTGGGHGHGGGGAMSLRSAYVDFGGVISDRSLLDDRICDCCQTSLVSWEGENFTAFYRDRSGEEIRDIGYVKLNDNGTQTKPKIIHPDEWHIAGCPVNGPRAATINDKLGVTWYTMGTDEQAKVLFATSDDGGETYSTPLLIDQGSLGRVDILATNGVFYISYLDKLENGSEIKIAEIRDNKIIATHKIVQVSSSRKTGFPRMALLHDGILIAYTDIEIDKMSLKFLSF